MAGTLHTLATMQQLASELAGQVKRGDIITLHGTLGTGKTTFARAFITALAPDAGEVTSPTFSLMQVYDTPLGELWHMDLYRLNSAEEAIEMGIEDGLGSAILLIEWPEVIEPLLPRSRIAINLEYGNTPETRTITVHDTRH